MIEQEPILEVPEEKEEESYYSFPDEDIEMPSPEPEKNIVQEEKKEYARMTPEERQRYITEHAPQLERNDMLNSKGEIVDFSEAKNLEELIEMIRTEGSIKNNVGEEIPADALINCIYDRLLNRNDELKDWTKITLRHRLREMVYRFAEDYMKTQEFKALEGLDLQHIHTLQELEDALIKRNDVIDAQGVMKAIQKEEYDALPRPLYFKARFLIEEEKRLKPQPRWKKAFSRLGSFFGR